MSGFRLRHTSLAHPLSAVLAEIAGAFAEALAGGQAVRIKACQNPDCLWFFVDSSRNRSRRWCESATCGNLMKVRRFRERQRVRSQTGESG